MGAFHCDITIINSTPKDMDLKQFGNEHGAWKGGGNPPGTIAAGESVSITLEPTDTFTGPNGYITYGVKDSGEHDAQIKFFFACPFSGANVVDWVWDPTPPIHPNVTATFTAQTNGGENPWTQNSVSADGSPVKAIYTVVGH